MLSPAGSTSTGTPIFFQIRSIPVPEVLSGSFSLRDPRPCARLPRPLPWHCRHIPLRSKPPAAGSPPGALLPEPADEARFFRRWIVPVARSPAPRTTIRSFFFIFAVFLLSFQQPPFSSVFRGLPRYSRARITLFPLIKYRKGPVLSTCPRKKCYFLLFQTTSETTHRRLRGLLVQTSGTASGILFPFRGQYRLAAVAAAPVALYQRDAGDPPRRA